ncbi:MAG: nicotinate-nucleotide adenylyltransferase [Deltaproteobacteria bacterium]|nr:nicotinate-nucleotide adenylyltransferase [Deltaproteobacteria bacterium]
MKKIGLFGGTFNPIHFGHLRSAEEIFDSFHLDRIIFIPSAYPPHKITDGLAPASLRVDMVHLAIAGNPRFSLSELEVHRPGKSYSVETIGHFRRQFGSETDLYFILGLDAFLEINTWKQYTALFELCHFIVMNRPGFENNFSREHLPVELAEDFCYDEQKGGYIHSSGYGVFPKEITALDISSTKIRDYLQKGLSVKYLMPAPVEEFIYRNNLYQTKDSESVD